MTLPTGIIHSDSFTLNRVTYHACVFEDGEVYLTRSSDLFNDSWKMSGDELTALRLLLMVVPIPIHG